MMETHSSSRDHVMNNTSSPNNVQIARKPLPSAGGFVYRPLAYSEGEDFRLLSLHPGQFEDPLHCDIFHADIKSEIEYDAVSYTWATEDGDASLSHTITCGYAGTLDALPLRVTRNCASALRRLRDEDYERTIWIDAISINQFDIRERGHHVKSMADIFFGASQVMVYLGEEDLGFSSRNLWLDESKRRFAVEQLFAKGWASSVWAVQEIAFAQKVMIITGDATCHLNTDLLFRIRGRGRTYGCIVPGPLAWDSRGSVARRDLLSMLHISRDCRSTDPRDKVYGLIGFASESLQDLIKVDYSQSVEEVLTSTAGAIIVSREDLEILAYASSSISSSHANSYLPTWVPDWKEHCEEIAFPPQFQSDTIGPWRSLNKLSAYHSYSRNLKDLDWSATVQIPESWTTSPDSKPFIMVQAHCIGTVDDFTKRQTASALGQRLTGLLESKTIPNLWPFEFQWLLNSKERQEVSQFDSSFNRTGLISFCTELAAFGEHKFIFRAGHLPAITTAKFKDGDSVWAVDGCRIPLILRAINDDGFQIVGNCQLLSLQVLDCWTKLGSQSSPDQMEWQFDPFRLLKEHDSRIIDIY